MADNDLDFAERCAAFDARSYVPLLQPTLRCAEGHVVSYSSPFKLWRRLTGSPSASPFESLLDASQNAGCLIFGHAAPAAVAATDDVLRALPPLRLPLARAGDEESRLRQRILELVADFESSGGSVDPAVAAADERWWAEYNCVLGMRSGAEAIDAALSLAASCALAADATIPSSTPLPLMLVTLHGCFHGNCTRASFSASDVFRSHSAAGVLVDFAVASVDADASAADVDEAFAEHDAGRAICAAVLLEPVRHLRGRGIRPPHRVARDPVGQRHTPISM